MKIYAYFIKFDLFLNSIQKYVFFSLFRVVLLNKFVLFDTEEEPEGHKQSYVYLAILVKTIKLFKIESPIKIYFY